uniref:Uncharacterized protein n=1 Tax=Fagus sylvatica TaxID=28930 RepID=A0A2N9HZ36_FAGSY
MTLEKPLIHLPLLSRINPPALAGLGLPRAEPSVLSFRKPGGGGFQPIRTVSLGGLSIFWGRENLSSIAKEDSCWAIADWLNSVPSKAVLFRAVQIDQQRIGKMSLKSSFEWSEVDREELEQDCIQYEIFGEKNESSRVGMPMFCQRVFELNYPSDERLQYGLSSNRIFLGLGIALIACIKDGGSWKEIFPKSQLLEESHKSQTLMVVSWLLKGPEILSLSIPDPSQLSCQTLMERPL